MHKYIYIFYLVCNITKNGIKPPD